LGAVLTASVLAGCTTTAGTAELSPPAQTAFGQALSDAHVAADAAQLAVSVAVSAGELSGAGASEAQTVLAGIQSALTAADTALAAGSTTDVSAQLADVQALLGQARTAAPADADLIGKVQAMVTVLQALEAAR
jgi:hypothetical protein